ncbi:MAG: extracellular solute-binding protein [Candidatus Paceibacterota bacterium]
MKKISTFQIIVTGVFIFFIVAGVISFAGLGGLGGGGSVGNVVIWGTYDDNTINEFIFRLSNDDPRFDTVTYVEKDSRTFDADLVEALASGDGPDVFLLQQETVLRHKDKIFPIPYSTLSERDFKDKFIEEGELFLSSDGVVGLPLTVDPMVLYWNRDHYSQAGLSRPPKFWDELLSLTHQDILTTRGESGAIIRSAFALGEYQNIAHAKNILSMLILQAGGSIVNKDSTTGVVSSGLQRRLSDGQSPTENALRFYTDFANPAKSVYTWNRALPESREAFSSGVLSNYIGFASELGAIRKQNANLNFDVAPVPQVRNAGTSITYGNMTALAVSETSKNIAGALQIVFALVSDSALQEIATAVNESSVSRAVLSERSSDPFKVIFNDSALQSRGWLDPESEETNRIFKTMIEAVVSGRLRVNESVNTADSALQNLLR